MAFQQHLSHVPAPSLPEPNLGLEDLASLSQKSAAAIRSEAPIEIGADRTRSCSFAHSVLACPTHAVSILRARQAVLLALLRADKSGIYKHVTILDRIEGDSPLVQLKYSYMDIISKPWDLRDISSPRPEKKNRVESWSSVTERLVAALDYLRTSSTTARSAARSIHSLHVALRPFIRGDRTSALNALADSLGSVRDALCSLNKKLETQGVPQAIEHADLYPFSKKTPFKSPAHLQDFFRKELAPEGEVLNRFLQAVSALDTYLCVVGFIYENHLKPVTIVGSGGTRFSQMVHPDMRHRGPVPVSFTLDPQKPITIITGHNGTGKTKTIETLFLNTIYAQSIGFVFAQGGTLGTLRTEFNFISGKGSSPMQNTVESTGQRDMAEFVQALCGEGGHSTYALDAIDEALTSTDGLGALSVLLAVLMDRAERGTFSLVTLHNRAVARIPGTPLEDHIQLLRPGRSRYSWTQGVAHADAIKLAEHSGLPQSLVTRALEIQRSLEDGSF